MRRVSSRQLFFEIMSGRKPSPNEPLLPPQGPSMGIIDRSTFQRACMRKGMVIHQKYFWNVFMALDEDSDGLISYNDFKSAMFNASTEEPISILNNIKIEFEIAKLDLRTVFSRYSSNQKSLTFDDFSKLI